MLFGELLTSDNYDDTEKKVTGGRNGYGAKLTNIFSKKFIVETADSSEKKMFRQEWRNNMSEKEEPVIEAFERSADYTEVGLILSLYAHQSGATKSPNFQLPRSRLYQR